MLPTNSQGVIAMGDTNPAAGTRIDIVSDAICPWCYIGKRQLERALATLAQEGLHFSVHWNPFQLNPDMPKEGRDRAAYRAWKFGSAERARELDERIIDAASRVGLAFRTDLMLRTPNTLDAHRLIWLAGREGVQDATMEAVFAAYFVQGRDIGEAAVLADCAAAAGMDRATVLEFLAGDVAAQEMLAADKSAREAGVSGVPSFFLDGYGLYSGAQPAETMAEALRKGQQILRQRAA
jgi:predicted DsbA family dithiol-disulfide isomerase